MTAYTNHTILDHSDILSALDLDRTDILDINTHRDNNALIIDITLCVKPHPCPDCGQFTTHIKGYTHKRITHSVLNFSNCIINYRCRRYICPTCKLTFQENNPFAFKGSSISVATVYNVLNELKEPSNTFKYIANKNHISPSSVALIFDKHCHIPRRPLSPVICFDEVYAFKSDKSDYCCVILDYVSKKVIDILPSRRKADLIDYFYAIPIEERNQVRYVCYDMWQTYRAVGKLLFPNSIGILDKFHVLQEFTHRKHKVRTRHMNYYKKIRDSLMEERAALKALNQKFPPEQEALLSVASENYYLLKKFAWVFDSQKKDLFDPNNKKRFNRVLNRYCNYYDILTLIESISPQLEEVLDMQFQLTKFYRQSTIETAKSNLEDLMWDLKIATSPELKSFYNTLNQWKPEIINSFTVLPGSAQKRINNALIENRNKTIKLIKHSSNGYTNWNRFRNRVLYCLNDDVEASL